MRGVTLSQAKTKIAVVLAALGPLIGPYTAILALLMRGVVTAAEVVMAGLAVVMYRWYQRVPVAETATAGLRPAGNG